jgi:hypothetical protein
MATKKKVSPKKMDLKAKKADMKQDMKMVKKAVKKGKK